MEHLLTLLREGPQIGSKHDASVFANFRPTQLLFLFSSAQVV